MKQFGKAAIKLITLAQAGLVTTRQQALSILGLPENATYEEFNKRGEELIEEEKTNPDFAKNKDLLNAAMEFLLDEFEGPEPVENKDLEDSDEEFVKIKLSNLREASRLATKLKDLLINDPKKTQIVNDMMALVMDYEI
jgi:hypothetical protein